MERGTVFVVPVHDRWLVHAPLHGVSALVNRAAVRLLTTHAADPAARLADLAGALARPASAEPGPPEGLAQPDFIGLIPTRACNLSCVYCAFGAPGSGSETLPLRMTAGAIDWMAERAVAMGRTTLDVHFFGGEPFCAADVVDVAVHRARARAAALGLRPHFQVATNGCFDEARCRWVGDYFDTVVLSIDGPPDYQDAYRPFRGGCGSSEAVFRTARRLSTAAASLFLRLTVTDSSVSELPSIARSLCTDLQPQSIVFAPLQPYARTAAAGLNPPEPLAFARACVASFAAARKLGVRPVFAGAMIEERRHAFCPVGRDTLILAPDGRIGACYMLEADWKASGLDLNLGHVDDRGRVFVDPEAINRVRALARTPTRCRRCLARWHCGGGCRLSLSATAEGYGDFCLSARILTVCELLASLGEADSLAAFIQDPAALASVAQRPSDLASDWESAHARG